MKKNNVKYTTELIKKIQQGKKDAFNKLIPIYQTYVYKVALKYLHSKEDAEDLMQEVFIKLYKNLKDFKFKSNFKTYLYRITINSACNYYKQKKRIQSRTNPLINEEGQFISNLVNIDEKFIENETISDLKKTISNLPENHKTIINLKDFQNLTYKQISKKLNISENAAKIRHHYALKKLKNLFRV